MTLPDGVVRGQTRLDFTQDVAAQQQQQAALLERMQNGGINMAGLRVQLRAAAPVDAPAANQPTAVLVNTGGGPHLYVFVPGTGWTAMAQTVVPAAHVLATTGGLGAQHTVSGLSVGQVLRATGATGAAFAQLQFGDVGGVTTKAQLPAAVAYDDEANTFTQTNRFDGAITIADGAAATPSLRFTSDPDNGLMLNTPFGANAWSLVAGGMGQMLIRQPVGPETNVVINPSRSGQVNGVFQVAPSLAAAANGNIISSARIDGAFTNTGGFTNITTQGLLFSPQWGSSGSQTFANARAFVISGGTAGTVTIADWRGLYVTGAPAGVAGGTAFYGIYVADIAGATTNYSFFTNAGLVRLGDQLQVHRSADEHVAMMHTSATGNPYLSWNQQSTQRAFIQYENANSFNITTLVGFVQIRAGSGVSEIIRLFDASATGSPFVSWTQQGTRRSYIRFSDSIDEFQIVNEYGAVAFYVGTGGSTAFAARFTGAGSFIHAAAGNLNGNQFLGNSGDGAAFTVRANRSLSVDSAVGLTFQTNHATSGFQSVLSLRRSDVLVSLGLTVLGDMEIDGALNHDGSTVGFYATAPVVQAASISKPSGGGTQDAEARTAIDALIDALGASAGIGVHAG